MKYFVYKKNGNNNLYWSVDKANWVTRTKATVYDEEMKCQVARGAIGGTWHEVVAEPVKYGEQPRPIPVFIGDGVTTIVEISGYYWFRNQDGESGVTYLSKGQAFANGHMFVYIKEPPWPQ